MPDNVSNMPGGGVTSARKAYQDKEATIMMKLYSISTLSEKRFNVKEHITMSENLEEAISQLLMNYTEKAKFNNRVKVEMAETAALIRKRVRYAQFRFVDLKNNDKLNETTATERLVRIMELKEEYENLRFRMFAPLLIDENTDSQKWRCIFRTIRDRNTRMTILDFARIYNKWTVASADYLILKALCDLECGEIIERTDVQIKLAEEYEEKFCKQEELLDSYFQDLHSIATELELNCNIFEILENILDDESIIQPTIICRKNTL